jgi:hypothetical protein
MNRYLDSLLLLLAAVIAVQAGCNRAPQLRLECRTHGYDFVDEHGEILATADSLDEIGPILNEPVVQSKLEDSRVSVQFYRVSRRRKGFQVPRGISCAQIIATFETELRNHGIHQCDVNYENW